MISEILDLMNDLRSIENLLEMAAEATGSKCMDHDDICSALTLLHETMMTKNDALQQLLEQLPRDAAKA